MQLTPVLAPSPAAWIAATSSDLPVHFFCPAALADRVAAFRAGFPGDVTFAVKANPAAHVIDGLWAGGIVGFDVASPQEMALIAAHCPGAALHYHNPVRSMTEIAAGMAHGCTSWSVDCAGELDKLIAAGLRDVTIAVRFALQVDGAAYNFGEKFGATPDQAANLLQQAAEAGFIPALTFHVGTQCKDPAAWVSYIDAARRIAQQAGVTLATLNVGGGFPSGRDGTAPDHAPIFAAIRDAVAKFDAKPHLVCEPGRGLVADAFAYGVQIKSRRTGRVYLTDGIYGGLSECPSIGVPKFAVRSPSGQARLGNISGQTVYGPTCDSLDRLPGQVALPDGAQEGDWLIFRAMGAYVTGVTTTFNGYGQCETVTVQSLR